MAKKSKSKSKSKSSGSLLSQVFGEMNSIFPGTEEELVTIDPHVQLPHIPSRSLVMDRLLGGPTIPEIGGPTCPGYPKGRICMLTGEHSTGKTTLALEACAQVTSMGGTALYLDWEHEVSELYAHTLGCPADPNKFQVWQPPTLEKGIAGILLAADSGVDLIVVDSVGAGMPQKLFDQSVQDVGEELRMGLTASLWSRYLPKIKTVIKKSGTSVLAISQLRSTISKGGGYGGPTKKQQGGKSWEFYSAVHIFLRLLGKMKGSAFNPLTCKIEKDSIIGVKVLAELKKCKISKEANKSLEYYVRSGEGIDNVLSMIEIGVSWGLIKKAGAWFTFVLPNGKEIKSAGMENFRNALITEGPSVLELLEKKCRENLCKVDMETHVGTSEEVEDAISKSKNKKETLIEGLAPKGDDS